MGKNFIRLGVLRVASLPVTTALIVAVFVALACGPSAPSRHAGVAVQAAPEPTATPDDTATPEPSSKLDITMAGLVARHKAVAGGAAGASAPGVSNQVTGQGGRILPNGPWSRHGRNHKFSIPGRV